MSIDVPMLESSSPASVLIGHSTFSAPGSLRTFFHSVLESTPAGSPEMTTVRIARGSVGPAGRLGRGAAPLGAFCLGSSPCSWSLFYVHMHTKCQSEIAQNVDVPCCPPTEP